MTFKKFKETYPTGTKFKLYGGVYHVVCFDDAERIIVLKEWWQSKQRWNYVVKDEIRLEVESDYITDVQKPGK